MQLATPEQLLNTYRRFGRFGPAYQVIGIIRQLEGGDCLMKVHVVESEEDVEYPLSNILNDPAEVN
jgi:hypothetical protein